MRVGAHPPFARRRERGDLGPQRAVAVEQFFRTVAFHPGFEQLHVSGFGRHFGKRHLMRAPKAFGLQPVDLFGASPTFGGLEDDRRY